MDTKDKIVKFPTKIEIGASLETDIKIEAPKKNVIKNQTNPIYKRILEFKNTDLKKKFSLKDLLE